MFWGRLGLALAAAAVLSLPAAAAGAPRRPKPEPRAEVTGVADRALRLEIVRAVGDAGGHPANRIEARRRARDAAASAAALLRSEGYYDFKVEPDIGDGDHPRGVIRITPGPRTLLAAPAIEWIGAPPAEAAETAARSDLKLSPGAPGRAVDVIAAESRAVTALQARGYADAKAQPRDVVVDHADRTMRPTFRIAAGALVRMDGMQPGRQGRPHPHRQALAAQASPPGRRARSTSRPTWRSWSAACWTPGSMTASPWRSRPSRTPTACARWWSAWRTGPSTPWSLGVGYSTTEGVLADTTYLHLQRAAPGRHGDLPGQGLRPSTPALGVTESLPHFLNPGQTLRVGPDAYPRRHQRLHRHQGGEAGAPT